MMNTSAAVFEELKSEIRRAYRVLGKIYGEMQNDRDIDGYEKSGEITHKEAAELRRYNRELARTA